MSRHFLKVLRPDGGMSSSSQQISITLVICAALSVLFWLGTDVNFLAFNYEQFKGFVWSLQFLFFVVAGLVLCNRVVTDAWYDRLTFIFIITYLFAFYVNHLDHFRMAGDNICQIAYWNILSRPDLSGSIGASFTKPGQMLVFGALHQMSLVAGPLVFTSGLCLIMATCIWSLVKIATDIGGRYAGIMAFPLSAWALLSEFLGGSSSLLLIPSLFIGLWLYFYRDDSKALGRFLIVLSIQFHIQAISVLVTIWLILLARKDWRELSKFSVYSLLSLLCWLALIYRVQGAMGRLNSGVAAGYAGVTDTGMAYMFTILKDGFIHQPYVRLLTMLGVMGVVGAVRYGYAKYLSVLSSIVILVINVVMLGGTFNLERYCATFYAFSCSVGIGTVVRFGREALDGRKITPKISAIVLLLALVGSFDYSILNSVNVPGQAPAGESDYVTSARKILSDPIIGNASRLLTEDDILYSLVVMSPDRFSSLAALQYFNVADESTRKRILLHSDYIWIALNNGHPYYYLPYLAVPSWESDPFRRMILAIIETSRPGTLYGFTFVPVDLDHDRLVVKVVPENTFMQQVKTGDP